MVLGIGQAKKCEALAKSRKAGLDGKAESCLFVMNQSALRFSVGDALEGPEGFSADARAGSCRHERRARLGLCRQYH